MSNSTMTKDEWLSKASWEGGIIPGIEYGLSEKSLAVHANPENPEHSQEEREFYSLIKTICDKFSEMREALDEAEAMLSEIEEDF